MIATTRRVLSAKGDLLTRNAVREVRVPLGTNGQALVADSAQAAGLKWATLASGDAPASLVTGDPSIAVGAELTLVCTATGLAPLTYQWLRGGTVVGTNSPFFTVAEAALEDSGEYRCAVANAHGTVFSEPLALAVLTPPTLVSETPPDSTPTLNSYVDFALTATGSALAYQWQKQVGAAWADVANAGTLTGATTNTLTLQATLAHAGTYRCRVGNAVGEVFTAPMPIAMTPPVIVTQPAAIGTDGTCAVAAAGVGTLAYQWEFGGVAISGQNTPTLTVGDCLDNLDLTRGHRFRCRVSNPYGYVLSEEVGCRPFRHGAASGPGSVTRAQPAPAVLVAGLVAPPGALYAWTRNGTPIGSELDLFGASLPRLTLRNVQLADAGTYVCTASNVFGSAASVPIEVPVADDDTVHSHPGNEVTVFSDETVNVECEARFGGIPPVGAAGYYQNDRAWLPRVTGTYLWADKQAKVTYLGPTLYTPDTGLGVAPSWQTVALALNGATLAPLTDWKLGQCAQAGITASGDVQADPFLAAGAGDPPDIKASLTSRVLTRADLVSLTPSQTLVLGEALALTLAATGDDLEYAWWRTHADVTTRLPAFTTATLNLAAVGPGDAGLYLVRVGNRSHASVAMDEGERLVNVLGILTTPANGPRASGAVITADYCGSGVEFAHFLDGVQVGGWQPSPAFTVGTNYGTWVLKVRHAVLTDKLHASGEFIVTAP